MQLKPEEISNVIRSQIKYYENTIKSNETGTILNVGDGIARAGGLINCMAGELLEFEDGSFRAELICGDARNSLPEDFQADAVLLDGFSPDTNPELWTQEFIAALKARMKPDGMLATYSTAYPVCGALLQNGFLLYNSEPFGRKRGSLLAALQPQSNLPSLSEKDRLIITKSTAGTPYSDPELNSTREQILHRHLETVTMLRKQGIPKWFRK